MIVQVVESSVVTNMVVVPDGATLSGNMATWSGGGSWTGPGDSTLYSQSGAGIGWTLSGGTLYPPTVAAPTQTQLLAFVPGVVAGLFATQRGYAFSFNIASATYNSSTGILAVTFSSAPLGASVGSLANGQMMTTAGITLASGSAVVNGTWPVVSTGSAGTVFNLQIASGAGATTINSATGTMAFGVHSDTSAVSLSTAASLANWGATNTTSTSSWLNTTTGLTWALTGAQLVTLYGDIATYQQSVVSAAAAVGAQIAAGSITTYAGITGYGWPT